MSKKSEKLKGLRKAKVKQARIMSRRAIPVRYFCPCCGYATLTDEPPGTFDVCEICWWEDDPVQFDDPDYAGGANSVSLRQGQRNFLQFGAVEDRVLPYIRRPDDRDSRDPNWKKLE